MHPPHTKTLYNMIIVFVILTGHCGGMYTVSHSQQMSPSMASIENHLFIHVHMYNVFEQQVTLGKVCNMSESTTINKLHI